MLGTQDIDVERHDIKFDAGEDDGTRCVGGLLGDQDMGVADPDTFGHPRNIVHFGLKPHDFVQLVLRYQSW